MSKTKILIVEDNALEARELKIALTEHEFEVVGIAKTGADAKRLEAEHEPDVIFMDIELKGSLSGIETANLIHNRRKVPIIFLTANTDQTTFDATGLVDYTVYLTKPYLAGQLKISVLDALRKAEHNATNSAWDEWVFIRKDEAHIKVNVSDIQYLEADGAYCHIATTDGKFIASKPMKAILEKIENHPDIMKVSRSFSINIRHFELLDGKTLKIGQKSIPVSDRYLSQLKDKMNFL